MGYDGDKTLIEKGFYSTLFQRQRNLENRGVSLCVNVQKGNPNFFILTNEVVQYRALKKEGSVERYLRETKRKLEVNKALNNSINCL